MNTRLQVEHPITEYITGVDIVEEMIYIASGEPLRLKQEQVGIKGWAFESRVYAENPLKNFLPSIGRLNTYIEPTTPQTDSQVRYDTGVVEGSEISMYYDPLICKLITHGNTRDEARRKMIWALDRYQVHGPKNNINFLRSALENPKMITGDISTKFIPEEFPDGYKGHDFTQEQLEQAAVSLALHDACHSFLSNSRHDSLPHFSSPLSRVVYIQGKRFQVDLVPSETSAPFFYQLDGQKKDLVESLEGEYFAHIFALRDDETPHNHFAQNHNNSNTQPQEHSHAEPKTVRVSFEWGSNKTLFLPKIEGKEIALQLLGTTSKGYKVIHCGTEIDVNVLTQREDLLAAFLPEKKHTKLLGEVLSPMPGTVRSISVKEGDKVNEGDELLVLEAMKMQNLIVAPKDGVVKKVFVTTGGEVDVDAVLVLLE